MRIRETLWRRYLHEVECIAAGTNSGEHIGTVKTILHLCISCCIFSFYTAIRNALGLPDWTAFLEIPGILFILFILIRFHLKEKKLSLQQSSPRR